MVIVYNSTVHSADGCCISSQFSPRATWDLRRRTEIIPVKDPHTRIQNILIPVDFDQRPRPLHNRYTRTDYFVRCGMAVTHSRCKFVAVSLPKRFRNGRFTSETAVRRFQNRNRHLDPESALKNPMEILESSRYNSFSRRRQFCK